MKKSTIILLVVTVAALFAVVAVQPALAGSKDTKIEKMGTEKAAKSVKVQKKININTADEGTLANLKGIGPELAKRIVDYRSKSGKFKSIAELKNVQGIGDKTLADIASMITVK